MNQEPQPNEESLASLGMDLARSFQPAWTKQIDSREETARLIERHGDGDRDGRMRGSDNFRRSDKGRANFRGDRGKPRQDEANKSGPPQGGGRGPGGKESRGPARDSDRGRRGEPRHDRRDKRNPAQGYSERSHHAPQPPLLSGWDFHFLPEPAGVEGLARQIKHSLKAYPLFELARLVLEKPDRYRVRLVRKDGPMLHQAVGDGSLWLSEESALRHACEAEFDRVFANEETPIDPPKGNFTCIAQCGLSGTLIAPPNHHDYQSRIVRLHAEKFSRMPFAAYQRQIQMIRDEAIIEKWKSEQSVKREFVQRTPAPDSEPLRFSDRSAALRHLRTAQGPELILSPGDDFTVPASAITISDAPIQNFARQSWEKLVRFPLALSHELGRELTSQGCATFKLDSQIVYAGVVRPRTLDRSSTPVSHSLAAILDTVAAIPDAPRPEQWQAILTTRPPDSDTEEARKSRDHSVLADLHWLLREGYLIDFAGRGFAPGSAPARKKKKHAKDPSDHGQSLKQDKSQPTEESQSPPTDTVACADQPLPEIQSHPALIDDQLPGSLATDESVPDSQP